MQGCSNAHEAFIITTQENQQGNNRQAIPALRQHRISTGVRKIPEASKQTPHLKPHSPVLLCPFTLTP